MDLVRKEGAILFREAEAKISDARWPTIPTQVNPHHLTTARSRLIQRDWIVLSDPIDDSGTRVLMPSDQKGRRSDIRDALRRRAALHKRMDKWARPTSRYRNGLIGEAGERVARKSLVAAAQPGVRPVNAGAAEVVALFGTPVPGGSLDSGAWVDFYDEYGQATGSILCPIEVKNIRHWIYPGSHELFQLLYKAAELQEAAPDLRICPVLVTRKRAWIADRMSRELGFRILDVHKQYILPIAEVTEEELAEVQQELGYQDLTRTDDVDPSLAQVFGGTMRSSAAHNADAWKVAGSQLGEHYGLLRDPGLSEAERAQGMEDLRDEAEWLGVREDRW